VKRSVKVPLLLLGTLSVLGKCSYDAINTPQLTQQCYANKDDCLKDWDNLNYCKPDHTYQPNQPRYVGPRYYWNRSLKQPMMVDVMGNEQIISSNALTAGAPSSRSIGSMTKRRGFGNRLDSACGKNLDGEYGSHSSSSGGG
jgi:hypothetical protein